MKSLKQHPKSIWLIGNRVVMTLVFALAICGLSISPAFADHDDDHEHGNHYGQNEWHRDHDDYGNRYGNGYGDGYRYQQPYRYAQPVYVPPPVYYAPQQSPGVSLFLPLNFR